MFCIIALIFYLIFLNRKVGEYDMPTYHNITQFQKYLIEYAPDSSIEKEQLVAELKSKINIYSNLNINSIVEVESYL